MRILGLDIGEKRIGVALSDPTATFAQPLLVLTRGPKLRGDLRAIAAICRDHEVEEVVVGLPLSMSGEAGSQAGIVRELVGRLRDFIDLPIVEWDERLSTVAAERALLEGDVRRRRRRQVIDKTAAALILSSYLDYRAQRRARAERDVEE